MNASIQAGSNFIVGVYPRVNACAIGVVISFEGSGAESHEDIAFVRRVLAAHDIGGGE